MGILDIHERKNFGYFEYSWSDVMGIYIHKVSSWIFGIFLNWRHEYFEYSWSDVKGLEYSKANVIGYLKIDEVTSR